MAERIHCLNPKCRRTFAPTPKNEGVELVCAKCWKLLPASLRRRYKELRKRWRLVDRLEAKGAQHRRRGRKFGNPGIGAPQAYTMAIKMDKIWRIHWGQVRAFYHPTEKPEGLDTFLEEIFR